MGLQGTVLDTIFFLLYRNDHFKLDINGQVNLFSDDAAMSEEELVKRL